MAVKKKKASKKKDNIVSVVTYCERCWGTLPNNCKCSPTT